MAWSLITAPDEISHCCFLLDGARCPRPSIVRITDGSWDGYTYTCGDHAQPVLASAPAACTVEVVDEQRAAALTSEIFVALVAELRGALRPAQDELSQLGDAPQAVRARAAIQRVLDHAAACRAKLDAVLADRPMRTSVIPGA